MLRIREVLYGVPQFGPAAGQRGLDIEVYDDTGSDQSWDNKNSYDVPVYAEFKETLEKKGFSEVYTKAIDGSQGVFLYWKGGDVEKAEVKVEFEALVNSISQDSITLQKELMKQKKDFASAMLAGGVRPPFMVWHGVPKVFSGTRDFYQSFNFVLAELDDGMSEIALREILNHQNSQILVRADKESDLDKIPDKIAIRKVSVLDRSEGLGVYGRCVRDNYRYYKDGHGEPIYLF